MSAKKKAVAPKVVVQSPHARGWAHALRSGKRYCFYCRLPFREERPPTIDHVVPLMGRNETAQDRRNGWVLACGACNTARLHAPFDAYVGAVQQAWAVAESTGRDYRRPRSIFVWPGDLVLERQ